jgi:hypothetical protein
MFAWVPAAGPHEEVPVSGYVDGGQQGRQALDLRRTLDWPARNHSSKEDTNAHQTGLRHSVVRNGSCRGGNPRRPNCGGRYWAVVLRGWIGNHLPVTRQCADQRLPSARQLLSLRRRSISALRPRLPCRTIGDDRRPTCGRPRRPTYSWSARKSLQGARFDSRSATVIRDLRPGRRGADRWPRGNRHGAARSPGSCRIRCSRRP